MKISNQIWRTNVKGIKMLRMAKRVHLASLVFCVPFGCPTIGFYPLLIRHVSHLVSIKKNKLPSVVKTVNFENKIVENGDFCNRDQVTLP